MIWSLVFILYQTAGGFYDGTLILQADEKVKILKYLGSLRTNESSIHEEIKCTLKSGNSSNLKTGS